MPMPVLKIEIFSGATIEDATREANDFFAEKCPDKYEPIHIIHDREDGLWKVIVPHITFRQ